MLMLQQLSLQLKSVAASPPSPCSESLSPTTLSFNGNLIYFTLMYILNIINCLCRESDFSADVKNDIIMFEQKSFLKNLQEIRDALVKAAKQ